jgi:hypothetical protein
MCRQRSLLSPRSESLRISRRALPREGGEAEPLFAAEGVKRREIRETAYFVDAAADEILPRLYDCHGKPRWYLRRAGHKRVPLPGLPWSPEFMASDEAAMAGSKIWPGRRARTSFT